MILEHGAMALVGSQKRKNEVVFLTAVTLGEMGTVRRLLDREAVDVSSRNRYGLTFLQVAIVNRQFKVAEYLHDHLIAHHDHGRHVSSETDSCGRGPDTRGWTALHDAVLQDAPSSLVLRLIAKGYSVTATTNHGELPIDLATSIEMEHLLCQQMAQCGEEELARQYFVYLGLEYLGYGSLEIGGAVSAKAARKEATSFSISTSTERPGDGLTTNDVVSQAGKPHCGCAIIRNNNNSVDERYIRVTSPISTFHGKNTGTVVAATDCSFCEFKPLGAARSRSPPPNESGRLTAARSTEQNSSPQYCQQQQQSSPKLRLRDSLELTKDRFARALSFGYLNERASQTSTSRRQQRIRTVSSETVQELTESETENSPEIARAVDKTNKQTVTFHRDVDLAMAGTQSRDHRATTGEAAANDNSCSNEASRKSDVKGRGVRIETTSVETTRRCGVVLDPKVYQGADSGNVVQVEMSADDSAAGNLLSTLDLEVPLALLSKKPRKSSISASSRERRRCSEGRRRSVTFQPEVLLQEIVTDGDAKEVTAALLSGAITDINKMSPAGLTALHQAAIDGNMEVAETLVNSGADVNSTDCEEWTPLHAAVHQGHEDFVRFLLQNGAGVSLKNENGETAYNLAKRGSNIRKLLLRAMNNNKEGDGEDFSDGEYSSEEEMQYSHAESESDEESEGAYFESEDNDAPSLKERLGLSANNTLLKTPSESTMSPSPESPRDAESDSVFSNKSKPLQRSKFNFSVRLREPTDSTSSYGSMVDPEIGKHLDLDETPLSRSDDCCVHSDTDKTSEDQGISTMDGSSDCCLTRGGVSSDDEGSSYTPDESLAKESLDYVFQEACLQCNVDNLLKLVKNKKEIDLNRINEMSGGITALHHVVLEENFALVQHLVREFEVDINTKDVDGWTPLHAASAVGNIRIAQFLLESGAKASLLNNNCEFPVDVADSPEMEKLLENAMLGPGIGRLCKH